jgi:hypothetical protein
MSIDLKKKGSGLKFAKEIAAKRLTKQQQEENKKLKNPHYKPKKPE